MPQTIFDRILDGDLPCHKVFEDEWSLAFLDIFPLSEGHTLVIPKKERKAHLHELSPEQGAGLGRALVRVASAVCKATGASAYNVLQNNGLSAHQAIFHVHFHIIPKTEDRGLGIGWQPRELDQSAAPALAARIASHL